MSSKHELASPIDDAIPATARPIFIVGAPRSGVSLLTLSLAQHANLATVLETNWFERMAIGLQQAYSAGISPRETSQLDAMGLGVEAFSACFGDAIDRMMLQSVGSASGDQGADPVRWIDGSRNLAFQIVPLLLLFPRAKVIHVFREAGEVVATLSNKENRALYRGRSVHMSRTAAMNSWMNAVTACVEAERAFGSETVLRIRRRDLVASPEIALRRCLEFIEEPFDPACFRPFRPLAWEPEAADQPAKLEVSGERVGVAAGAELLSRMLMDEGMPHYPRDEQRIFELQWAFGEQSEREVKVSDKRPHSRANPIIEQAAGVNPTTDAPSAHMRQLPSLVRLVTRAAVKRGAGRDRS